MVSLELIKCALVVLFCVCFCFITLVVLATDEGAVVTNMAAINEAVPLKSTILCFYCYYFDICHLKIKL